MADSHDIIIHGPSCPFYIQPITRADWKFLECHREKVEHEVTFYLCPSCNQYVCFVLHSSTVDLSP